MSRYLVTSGSHFEPFTYDELVKPIAQAQAAHKEAAGEADTLAMQAGAIGSMIDNSSPKAKALYDSFMQSAEGLVDDLSANGYSANTASALSKLRRAYGVDMTKVNSAITKKAEAVKSYDDDVKKDKTLITDRDPRTLSVDDFLDDPYAGNYNAYSGTMLTAKASAIGENLKRDIIENQDVWSKILGGQYFERNEFVGFHASEVQEAIRGLLNGETSTNERVKLLQTAMNNVYQSSGMGEWATPDKKAQALSYIGDGIYSAIGDKKNSIQQNRNFMSDYQRRMLDIQAARAKGKGNGQDTTVAPGIASLRGNTLNGITDRKQSKDYLEKKAVYDGLSTINRLKKSGALYNPNGTLSDAANDAALSLYKNDYYKQLTNGESHYLSNTDLDPVLASLEKELSNAVTNDHAYTMNITPKAASNIATSVFKPNIGQLSGKNGDSIAGGVATYSNGDSVKAKDLLEILDSDNLVIGHDAKLGKITVQRVGGESGSDKGKYDDRVVYLDPKTVLTGTSAYANAAQILYALNYSIPDEVSQAAKEKVINKVASLATTGQTIDLRNLSDIIQNSYLSMMKNGTDEDKAIFNSLEEAFCLGLFDSSNTQWSPNNYREGWSAKTGGSAVGGYDDYMMEDLDY